MGRVLSELPSEFLGPSTTFHADPPAAFKRSFGKLTFWTPSAQKNLAPNKRATDEPKTTSEELRNDLEMSFGHRIK